MSAAVSFDELDGLLDEVERRDVRARDPVPTSDGSHRHHVRACGATVSAVIDEVERAVVGKRAELELILAALLAGGHVLLDDVPGVAKTLAARSIATAAGLSFSRIQFMPDVLPSDITGATVIDLSTGHPTFRRGPVFAELVLADEINRAPAKTQAALLEAMQESQVTIDGTTHPLPSPFFVIATGTRWSQRGPIRCRKPSSTGSSCGPTSDTPPSPTRSRWWLGVSHAAPTRS